MSFSSNLIQWFHQFGRKKLHWQKELMPYPVWVSEIMLQQTQVKTAIPYFQRFIAQYPTLQSLAAASLDDVLQLWAGLGYYARARNLHRAAQWIVLENQGAFPQTLTELQKLPGLGRSTASAILAICFGLPYPILDGNVKRVLARYRGITGYPGDKTVEALLWKEAEALLPSNKIPAYTQAIMDLGALICLPKNPNCWQCPVSKDCTAKKENRVNEFPYPKPKQNYPTREAYFALFFCRDKIWLSPRPTKGIWGGLWCLPEFQTETDLLSYLNKNNELRGKERLRVTRRSEDCSSRSAAPAASLRLRILPAETHLFTHYRLFFTPVLINIDTEKCHDDKGQWIRVEKLEKYGLPAPIKRLLSNLFPVKLAPFNA